MSGVHQTMRGLLEGSFRALPVLLFGWALFVGSTTGNVGMLVLALGQATVVPFATWILHSIASFFGDFGRVHFTVPSSATCNILPGGFTDPMERVYSIPSYWLAQIAFFFGFLLSNASYVLNMPSATNAPADKVERRKSQAQLVQILGWAFFALFIGVRSFVMGCETVPGVLLGGLAFWWIGNGWYQFARECSAKDSDLFGIVQGILPPSATEGPPMACVYTK
jgi:hypothetical protein